MNYVSNNKFGGLCGAAFINKTLCALNHNNNQIELILLDKNLNFLKQIAAFEGCKGFLLDASQNKILLSVDNKLILITDGTSRVLLETERAENVFWHAAKAHDYLFVHEYGYASTSIWRSSNLEKWEKVVTNQDLEISSRHFHSICYDPFSDWLVATLGDWCLTRVVYSEDLGNTWRPLYKGPWQFVPIEASKGGLVFGMDSGIAKGGVGIFNRESNRWHFIFLKYLNSQVKNAQFCSLKRLSNGLWVAALATPQSIVFSRDLKTWYPAFVEGFEKGFSSYMTLSEGEDSLVCTTGKNLLLFRKDELETLSMGAEPVMTPYNAWADRLVGFGFVLKRKL